MKNIHRHLGLLDFVSCSSLRCLPSPLSTSINPFLIDILQHLPHPIHPPHGLPFSSYSSPSGTGTCLAFHHNPKSFTISYLLSPFRFFSLIYRCISFFLSLTLNPWHSWLHAGSSQVHTTLLQCQPK